MEAVKFVKFYNWSGNETTEEEQDKQANEQACHHFKYGLSYDMRTMEQLRTQISGEISFQQKCYAYLGEITFHAKNQMKQQKS